MANSISDVVRAEGQKLAASSGNVIDELNHALNKLLSWPFRAATGKAVDAEGQNTDVFGCLIYTSSQISSSPELLNVQSDSLACVIDVSENIGIADLHANAAD